MEQQGAQNVLRHVDIKVASNLVINNRVSLIGEEFRLPGVALYDSEDVVDSLPVRICIARIVRERSAMQRSFLHEFGKGPLHSLFHCSNFSPVVPGMILMQIHRKCCAGFLTAC